jgi:hypothetical protein
MDVIYEIKHDLSVVQYRGLEKTIIAIFTELKTQHYINSER